MHRPSFVALLLVIAPLLLTACAGAAEQRDAARRQNLAAASRLVVESPVTVVSGGEVVAEAESVEEALSSLEDSGAHRLWVVPAHSAGRLLPLVYLPAGGAVAGRELLESLGIRRTERTGRPTRLRLGGKSIELDVERPHLDLELRPLEGGEPRHIRVPLQHDFPAALLLPTETFDELDADRSELSGIDEVQVALGRPFRARRALLRVRLPALGAEGIVPVVSETLPAR